MEEKARGKEKLDEELKIRQKAELLAAKEYQEKLYKEKIEEERHMEDEFKVKMA